MHQLDEVREALDREFPGFAGRTGDWEDVLARSLATEPDRRRRRSPLFVLAAAIVAVAVGALLWPGGDSSARILERARAVVSAGPVIHLVMGPEDARMTEIDLATGKGRRLDGRHEQWFDPDRGVHDLHTIDGRVYQDVLYPAGSSPELEREYLEFASAYRRALESGRATVGERGVVNDSDVYWIRFHSRYPSVGISFDADHEVAVDAETFEPRVWRSTRESKGLGVPKRTTELQIEFWETLPAGTGDFTAATNTTDLSDPLRETAIMQGPRRTLEEARSVLSPPPLWLGQEFRGLPLVSIDESRAEHVYTGAPVEMPPELRFCYGACPARIGSERVVAINEANVRHRWQGWELVVEPAEGTLIIADAIHTQEFARGFARQDGVYLTIAASDEGLLVAAARALRPMPGASAGSGGGG